MGANLKSYQQFRLRTKKSEVQPGEVYCLDSTTIAAISGGIPKGVLIYDTDNNKMLFGKGTSYETITSVSA